MKTNVRSVKRCARLIGGLWACAGALLLSFLTMLAVQQRVAAATFPAGPDDDTNMLSIGVFRIIVAPEFHTLVEPRVGYNGYAGYHSADGRLTSPMLIDFNTQVGRGAPHNRPNPAPLPNFPWYSYFPDPIGAGAPPWDSPGIASYADYPATPAVFQLAPNNTEEVLTEIKSFILVTTPLSQCSNSMVPQVPTNWPMVRAGTFAGVAPRSIGMVQEMAANGPADPDYPARSFFDIFAEVNLPLLPGTYSSVAFPATGAVLVNSSPLIVTNSGLMSLPPQVTYLHGNTNAVDLRFKFDNPPYWMAGDIFGSLVLAGHGLIPYDSCYSEDALVEDSLGTPGASRGEMPPEWLRPTALFPSPATSYDSVKTDPNPPTGSYDMVTFDLGGMGTYYARNLSLGGLSNSIAPPGPGSWATCTSSNAQMTLQLSQNGYNFYTVQPTGSVQLSISNNIDTPNIYSTKIVQMYCSDSSGSWPPGPVMLRQSHNVTNASVGQHTIRPDLQGYRVSSFFDVWLELSTDGVNWYPGSRPVRLLAAAPGPRPLSIFISRSGTNVVLNWLNSFPLQTTTNLSSGTWTDVSGVMTDPYTNGIGPRQVFFRLRQ